MATSAQSIVGRAPRLGIGRLSPGRILAWATLGLLLVLTLFPFWWVLRTALSSQREALATPNSLAPVGTTMVNFERVLGLVSTTAAQAAGGSGQNLQFFLYLRNSIIVAVLVVAGQLFFSSLAGYAFARLQFPLRDKIFALYLSALMVPGIVTLIPNFLLIRSLSWENTFAGIIAPYFLMSPFAVFFLRQFFLGINRELEEAAKLDGASLFGTYWRIVLPIAAPAVTTLGILTFITTWNDYLWPFLIGKDDNVRVLTAALAIFRSQTPQGAPDWTGLMAATLVSMLPTLLLFGVLGRKTIDSIQFSGIK